ncbi:MAG TPA: hypothetical protein VMU54_10770, partial [Planctomycetota bacterium]|nr:hypothetical protein [Planctomycetota bacterium]
GIASVRSAQARKDETTGLICTDFTLTFSEIWKGSPPDPFVLVKAGGSLAGRASAIVGREYKLDVGETLVLFATPSQKESYAVIGLRQGLYRVGVGSDPMLFRVSDYPGGPGASSNLRLGALREQVYRVVPRPAGTAAGERSTTDSGSPGERRSTDAAPGSSGVPAPGASPPEAAAADRFPAGVLLVLAALGAIGATAVIFRRKL